MEINNQLAIIPCYLQTGDCWLVTLLSSNILVYLKGRIYSDKRTYYHTEIHVADCKLSISPSHSILTLGRSVPALTLITPDA